jgi:predicted nucleotidyltransferase
VEGTSAAAEAEYVISNDYAALPSGALHDYGAESSMTYHGVNISRDEIAAFCRRNHIRRLSLFGSILGDDFRPDSDVDVLVEFEPAHTPGLAFFAMQDELSDLIGRKVDLHTAGSLSKYFRETVLAEADIQYDVA